MVAKHGSTDSSIYLLHNKSNSSRGLINFRVRVLERVRVSERVIHGGIRV